jgi:hypothetical protein
MKRAPKEPSLVWRLSLLIILLLGVTAILLGNYYHIDEITTVEGGLIAVAVFLIARSIPGFTAYLNERKLKKSGVPARILDATARMKSILEGLGSEYYFIKDVASPYGVINYLVFNRWRGVFLLVVEVLEGEVKAVESSLWVNNKPAREDFTARALKLAHWCKNEMIQQIKTRPWITPMVVFTHAAVVADLPINGVMLVNINYLPAALQKSGRAVSSNSTVWDFRMKVEQGIQSSH